LTTPQKRKGTAWENVVANFLSEYWPTIERRQAGNQKDKGDLMGVPFTVFECKDHATLKLSEWTDHLFEQMEHAGAFRGVVIVKRKRRPVSEAYAVMPLVLYRELLAEAIGKVEQ